MIVPVSGAPTDAEALAIIGGPTLIVRSSVPGAVLAYGGGGPTA